MKQILSMSGLPLLLVLVCISVLSVSVAQATIVASGNTFLDAYGQLDATDNWIVATASEISQAMRDDFVAGTGSSGFDTEANLVFIYQIVNNGGGTDLVDTLRQAVGGTDSWGYFADWGLTDVGTAVGVGENMGPDTWPDGGGDMRHGGTAGFVKNAGAYVNPTSTTLGAGALDWYFEPALGADTGVSSLLVSTTRVVLGGDGWVPMSEAIHQPDCTWVYGFSNPHVPEPATAVLLGLGVLALLRRRRA